MNCKIGKNEISFHEIKFCSTKCLEDYFYDIKTNSQWEKTVNEWKKDFEKSSDEIGDI